jgi:hypothetical protein
LVIAPKCVLSATSTNNGLKRLFSHFSSFQFGEGYGSRIKFEILILHFENKNYFDMSLKQFATRWLFSFLEKRLFALVFGNEVFGENTS